MRSQAAHLRAQPLRLCRVGFGGKRFAGVRDAKNYPSWATAAPGLKEGEGKRGRNECGGRPPMRGPPVKRAPLARAECGCAAHEALRQRPAP